jgi:hypothetical protein
MGLTLYVEQKLESYVEQKLESADLIGFFDQNQAAWVAAAKEAYQYVKGSALPLLPAKPLILTDPVPARSSRSLSLRFPLP